MKLDKIWSLYKAGLKTFLHSKISNPSDVEDLLQEILIKIHTNLDSLKKEDSVKPWLFQIANRTIIDFYRKKGKESEYTRAESFWEHEENENLVKADLSRCIEPFLSAMPKEKAELLRVVDLDSVPQKAYAQKLGISYSTLKSRVQKARKDLKTLFDDCCHYSLDKEGNLIDFEEKPNKCKKC